jgi:hypothetical protein
MEITATPAPAGQPRPAYAGLRAWIDTRAITGGAAQEQEAGS